MCLSKQNPSVHAGIIKIGFWKTYLLSFVTTWLFKDVASVK